MNDEECIREIAVNGNASDRAIGLLFERYYGKFVAYLTLRRVGHADAEDLAQDVFIKIVTSVRGSNSEILSVRAYLYRALHNRLVDHIRAKKPEVRVSELSDISEQESHSIFEKVASRLNVQPDELGFLQCFQNALNAFFDADQDAGTAIQLAVEGFSGAEMSHVLGRTQGATREFLRQCRRKFQAVLQNMCVDYLPDRLRAT